MRRLATLLFATGCTTSSSGEVFTSGIHASITARASGNGQTLVSATLYNGAPSELDYVELTGDDRLIARANGAARALTEVQVLNTVVHRAMFDVDASGTAFEVAFERTIDQGAPSSTAALPLALEITSAPSTASRAQAFVVSWAPASTADAMSWSVSGDCVEDQRGPIAGDPGSVTIDAGLVVKRMGAVPDQCALAVTIERARPGTLDSRYGRGGSIAGVQARTATVMSTP
ncbi:MAG TPA: hypothetical protein VK427_15340 [Kofleriaceae bacterium]|nr:hypothetical protein [Kofleriaceae bacterium]